MKKAIIVCLMLIIVVPITTEAKKKPFGDGLYWELTENGTLVISGNGKMPDYDEMMWHRRKSCTPWGKDYEKIKTIVIQEGVTHIGNFAFCIPFSRKGNLDTYPTYHNVSIPNTVKSIGNDAFGYSNLKQVIIPESVESIGESAFEACLLLNSVNIKGPIKTIEAGTFSHCKSLESIELPNTITSIEGRVLEGAFESSGLRTITIPSSVKTIGENAFAFCSELFSVTIRDGVTTIGEEAFGNCYKLAILDIPNSVKSIGRCAFSYDRKWVNNGPVATKPFDKKIIRFPSSLLNDSNPLIWGISKEAFDSYKNGIHDESGKLLVAAKKGMSIAKKSDIATGECYYMIKENSLLGLMNSMGAWVIPLGDYKGLELAGDGYVRICGKNNVYSIINADGKEIIPNSRGYEFIGDYDIFADGFYVKKGRYGGYCDAQGREISMEKLPPTEYDIKADGGYSSVVVIMNGSAKYYKVSKNGRYGLTNAEGEEIVPPELDALEECGKGFLRFKVGDYWGVMNYMGKVTIPTDRGYTKIGNYVSLTKRFPYTMAGYKGECDATGRQISKIKVETPRQSTSVASSKSSSSSSSSPSSSGKSNSGNNTTTIHVEHHHNPVPVQQWQACFGCGGMGTMGCDNCGGSGTKYIGDRLYTCSRCNGRGIIPCNVCYGNKGQYVTVYK